MTLPPAVELAGWIRFAYPRPDLTHLKLQKLLFYGYGAALGLGREGEIGLVSFEAWQHGPVSRETYLAYRSFGAGTIPRAEAEVTYSAELSTILKDVLAVYGELSAWELREESHLESVWLEARKAAADVIPAARLKEYFVRKFGASVSLPVYLGRPSSTTLDGIPYAKFKSLHDMAQRFSAARA